MIDTIRLHLRGLLGVGVDIADVDALQMGIRAALVYVISLAVVRLGSKRFLSKASAFDVIVAIMLGSVMSRAINGSAPIGATLVGGSVLIAMHWLLATLAFRLDWFGPQIKGQPVLLIEDGEIRTEGLRKSGLSEHDLGQALGVENHDSDPSKVRRAYLERDGTISVIPFQRPPRVSTVSVEEGVQTVRIELD